MRTVTLDDGADVGAWRAQARRLLRDGVPPEQVQWQVGDDAGLFDRASTADEATDAPSVQTAAPDGPAVAQPVPRAFLSLADTVLAHRDPHRHAVLYRLLWRLTHGERYLLTMASDADVAWAQQAAKAVRRDMHKMKAFVRFREVATDQGPQFVAWFEPDHAILTRVAPFFVRRFAGMRWSILTPARSAHWDGAALTFGDGAHKADAPREDASEDLWRTYFASIFNPARLKVAAMTREMPVRYWKNLPEASLIPGLIRDASARMDAMVKKDPTSPKKHVPAPEPRAEIAVPAGSIASLRRQAAHCRACPLWQPATQTVFGEGPDDARVLVLGEQPGDQEDLAGKPFVGPAGQLFDRALGEAKLDRDAFYVTNTVKHFKFEPRGKRRIHARANAAEQAACRQWLLAELEGIRPQAIVCLGAMAAHAIFGSGFKLMQQRGQWMALDDGTRAFATVHPSYLLRLRGEAERQQAYADFVRDLGLLHDIPA